jgi:hypothetical protein
MCRSVSNTSAASMSSRTESSSALRASHRAPAEAAASACAYTMGFGLSSAICSDRRGPLCR